jgi:lipopolysaccharide/colanic/teichoic acid biosynthesis glycosyltransferase
LRAIIGSGGRKPPNPVVPIVRTSRKRGDLLKLRIVSVYPLPMFTLAVAVSAVAAEVAHWRLGSALLLGLGAAMLAALLDSVSSSRPWARRHRPSWSRRRGLSLPAAAGVVIALGVGWSVNGWGLAPLPALLAVLLAAAFSALAKFILDSPLPLLSRAFDVTVASLLVVVSSPLWLVISLAILLDEPGPVLYRARRVGHRGREFEMYKFRKMRRDAAGPPLTIVDDPRFTRVGRFLARTKLDEIPQLLNVLRGDMALVGPRPEDPSYVAAYPAEFATITRVRPGITGLSQIQYCNESALLVGDDIEGLYRDQLLPRKIDLDRYYASHHCLALDLRILAWTAVAIVAGAQVQREPLTPWVSFARAGASASAASADVVPEIT